MVDADSQGSAADWVENSGDENLTAIDMIEAPTERLLIRALDRVDDEAVAIVDSPPGNERLLAQAIDRADCVVVPTRIGGVETHRVEAVLAMVPINVPLGLVICSARTYTRDYQDAIVGWAEAGVAIWGTVPERVSIAAGPEAGLAPDGLEAYRPVLRRALRSSR